MTRTNADSATDDDTVAREGREDAEAERRAPTDDAIEEAGAEAHRDRDGGEVSAASLTAKEAVDQDGRGGAPLADTPDEGEIVDVQEARVETGRDESGGEIARARLEARDAVETAPSAVLDQSDAHADAAAEAAWEPSPELREEQAHAVRDDAGAATARAHLEAKTSVEDEPEPRFADESELRPGLEKAAPSARDADHLRSVLESLIFVSDRPMTLRDLAKLARTRPPVVRGLVLDLIAHYRGRGVELVEVAGGYQFRSSAANAPFVRELVQQKPVRLTRAQLETLSIIAYRQPATKPEIDDIRGVDTGSAIKVLLDRELIKILGRKEEAGRPLLYGTTPQFLEYFGLASLKDLPTLKEFSELSDESRALFEKKIGEPFALENLQDTADAAVLEQVAEAGEIDSADEGSDEEEEQAQEPEDADPDAKNEDAPPESDNDDDEAESDNEDNDDDDDDDESDDDDDDDDDDESDDDDDDDDDDESDEDD